MLKRFALTDYNEIIDIKQHKVTKSPAGEPNVWCFQKLAEPIWGWNNAKVKIIKSSNNIRDLICPGDTLGYENKSQGSFRYKHYNGNNIDIYNDSKEESLYYIKKNCKEYSNRIYVAEYTTFDDNKSMWICKEEII